MSRGQAPVERVSLGPCDCPGEPHHEDWADCQLRFAYGGLRAIANALQRRFLDPTLYRLVAVERGVSTWNLTDEKDKPVPVEIAAIDALDPRQARILIDHFDNETTLEQLRAAGLMPEEEAEAGPPNPSGGPSRDGSEVTPAPTTTPLPGDESPTGPTASPNAKSEPPSTSSARSSRQTSPTSS